MAVGPWYLLVVALGPRPPRPPSSPATPRPFRRVSRHITGAPVLFPSGRRRLFFSTCAFTRTRVRGTSCRYISYLACNSTAVCFLLPSNLLQTGKLARARVRLDCARGAPSPPPAPLACVSMMSRGRRKGGGLQRGSPQTEYKSNYSRMYSRLNQL